MAYSHWVSTPLEPPIQPRQHCRTPWLFGKTDSVSWIKGDSKSDRGKVAAAHMQHAYCWAIRQRATAQFGSVKAYAAQAGLKYDRFARVMRGEAPLRFEDVGTARIYLGDIHETAQQVLAARVVYA